MSQLASRSPKELTSFGCTSRVRRVMNVWSVGEQLCAQSLARKSGVDAPRDLWIRSRRHLLVSTFRRDDSERMTTSSNCSMSRRAFVKLNSIDTSSVCEASGLRICLERRRNRPHPIVTTTPCFDRHACQAPRRRSACVVRLIVGALVASGLHGHAGALHPPQPQSATAPAAILSEGATIQRSAVPGDTHRYEAVLAAGDFLEISVSQDQVLVTLSLREADGTLHRTANVPDIHPLPERMIFIAPVSGRYVIEVYAAEWSSTRAFSEPEPQSNSTEATPRMYSLQVVACRPATSEDRTRASWFDVLERAVELELLQTMEGLRQAMSLYREAAEGWRAAGDVPFEAETLEAWLE